MFFLKDFEFDPKTKVFIVPDNKEINYRDTSEEYLLEVLKNSTDVSSNSRELMKYIKDWPTRYHLSSKRANLLRALNFLKPYKYKKILELGSGCGAITRWLGENFEEIHAVEGNLFRTVIARERCRDLKNVSFFCANIQDLCFEKEYDLVTLIGVLEYAPVFLNVPNKASEACLSMLKKAYSAVKPDGLLLLAIENKLGIKYWSGCKEDHSGRLFEGIHGYPSKNVPITFSKKELTNLLKMAGFNFIEYYYLFPDYKLCNVIIKDEKDFKEYYIHNWLNFPFEDYTGRNYLFHEGLVLRNLIQAGLFSEFANSFLVIASPQKRRPYKKPNWIVKKIANHSFWSQKFHHIISLCRRKEGLKILRHSLSGTNHLKLGVLEFNLEKESDFIPGDLLTFSAWEAVFSNNFISNFLTIFHKFKDYLISHFYTGKNDRENYPLLRSEAIDCTLWNLIENEKGIFFIDKKWKWHEPVNIDFVLARTLFHFLNKISPFLGIQNREKIEKSIMFFMKSIYDNYNSKRNIENLNKEQYFQELVINAKTNYHIDEKAEKNINKCSIIIPVFNKLEFTKQCLDALYEVTPNGLFELIVVNNASTDGTKEFLNEFAKTHPNVKVIHNQENLGFAKACNQGARAAKGKYLVFLNNDTIPLKDWLEEMLKIIETEKNVGIVGSKLLYPNNTIQHAGVAIADFLQSICPYHIHRKSPADAPEVNVVKDYQAVTGACMLIPKELFDRLGGFDEGFLNGYEDVDLCFQVREAGYRVVYTPKSVLYHFESISEGRFKAEKENEKRLQEKWAGKIKPDIEIYLPKVSVIILNYNNSQDTIKCLESIYKNIKYKRIQVIVIDNGSKTEDVLILKKWFNSQDIESIFCHKGHYSYNNEPFKRELIFIENQENLGFAGGNNIGIKYALNCGADYVWLLNNDTIIDKDALIELIKLAEIDKKIGMVSSKLYCYHDPKKVQYNGEKVVYEGMEDVKGELPKPTNFATGCSLLMRRKFIENVGLLDEDYFLYFEDNDISTRALKAGWKVYYNPYSKIYHKGGASVGGWLKTPLSVYYATRNLLLYCYKHDGSKISEIFGSLKCQIFPQLNGDRKKIYAFSQGIEDFIFNKKGKTDIDFKNISEVIKKIEREKSEIEESLKNLFEIGTKEKFYLIKNAFILKSDEYLNKFFNLARVLFLKESYKKDKKEVDYYHQAEVLYNNGQDRSNKII